MRNALVAALAALTVLAWLPGCGPSQKELTEIRRQQEQILAKLRDIDRKLEKLRPAAARRRGPDPNRVYQLPVGASPIKGPADAPATIVEFSDFQCPFCARTVPLLEQVLARYPQKVRLVYKHFPLTSIHPYAMGAARAAVAAQRQGKFWEYHDLLFQHQRALQPDKLRDYAKQLGLDLAKFDADRNSPAVKRVIDADVALARRVGVRGTPTLFVNGKLLQNRSLEGFERLIDAALKGS